MNTSERLDAQGGTATPLPVRVEVLVVVENKRVTLYRVTLTSALGVTQLLQTRDWQQALAVAQSVADVAGGIVHLDAGPPDEL